MKTHNVHILSHGNRSAVIGRGETFDLTALFVGAPEP